MERCRLLRIVVFTVIGRAFSFLMSVDGSELHAYLLVLIGCIMNKVEVSKQCNMTACLKQDKIGRTYVGFLRI